MKKLAKRDRDAERRMQAQRARDERKRAKQQQQAARPAQP